MVEQVVGAILTIFRGEIVEKRALAIEDYQGHVKIV